MNRRQLMKRAGGVALGAGMIPFPKFVAGQPNASPARTYGEEMPDMLVSFLSKDMNALASKWDRQREKISTPSQIEERNRFVRAKFAEMIHGYPEKTPLNPVTVRVLERNGYRIECVMFESQPDFWVTSSLYIPTSGEGPFPGIISPCGHSFNGRLYPVYQAMYQNLALNGFVVLAYDPIGQGERREFWNPQTHKNEIGGPPTWEHSLFGQQLLLIGEDLTHYRIWDGMRAIDYLLTRNEVDKKRIGCAGQSGGGTLTKFIACLDERVQCAAIHEGGTANRWPIRTRPFEPLSTGDTEQHMFPGAIYGIDQVDLHVAIAPRPLLVTIEHYAPEFDAAARAIQNRYKQLGVPEKFRTVPSNDPHDMTVKLRIANTDWFCRWFYNRPGPATEPDFSIEPDENLYCTPNGSIRYSRQGQTISSRILRKQATLPPERTAPASSAELDSYRQRMGSEIREVLRIHRSDQPLAVRKIVTTPRKRYKIDKVEFLSEPGIYVSAWVFLPDAVNSRQAIVYISDTGNDRDGLEYGVLEGLVRKGRIVIAADVRGIGATRPLHPSEESRGSLPHLDDLETVLTYWAWAMDKDLFGMRVQDVLRTVDYALTRPEIDHSGVQIIGRGTAALWTLYAAALDTRIQSAICDGGLLSYRSLTSVDRYDASSSVFVRNILVHFDLPQVAAAVADRRLTILSPLDAMKSPVEPAEARRVYQITQNTYAKLGLSDRFCIACHDTKTAHTDRYFSILRS